MNARQFQANAHSFATYGQNEMYPFLGLTEEAGEVNGKLAKFIRKHGGTDPKDFRRKIELRGGDMTDYAKFIEDLIKELGDCLWMIAEIATLYRLDLEDIMEANIEKLADRKKRGVIVGEGDNR